MKLKKVYKYSDKNQIWRLLLSDSDKLIVEARSSDDKEVFYSAVDAFSGKALFKDYQFEEKFWIGIDKIYKDVIFLHKFAKPDMPQHKSIIAFDLVTQKVLWENDQFAFQFVTDDKVYASFNSMSGTKYFALNYLDGEPLSEIEISADQIMQFKTIAESETDYSSYSFPEQYIDTMFAGSLIAKFIDKKISGIEIEGPVEFIDSNGLLLVNYHKKLKTGKLQNIFFAVDIEKEKYIFDEVLNSSLNAFVPDSFFIYKNFVYLLKEKKAVIVCEIKG